MLKRGKRWKKRIDVSGWCTKSALFGFSKNSKNVRVSFHKDDSLIFASLCLSRCPARGSTLTFFFFFFFSRLLLAFLALALALPFNAQHWTRVGRAAPLAVHSVRREVFFFFFFFLFVALSLSPLLFGL